MKPLILVTTDRRAPAGNTPGARVRPKRSEAFVVEAYLHAVRYAGGIPLLLAPGEQHLEEALTCAHGVVLTGGYFDIHPSHYGKAIQGRLDSVDPTRTDMELRLAALAMENDLPMLGVCGGMQAIAVAAGGTLLQDLQTDLEHEQPTDPAEPWHDIRTTGLAKQILGSASQVNSTHHQAVEKMLDPLQACAWATDGTVEAFWSSSHRFLFGVQWHPELLGDMRPYQALISAAKTSTT